MATSEVVVKGIISRRLASLGFLSRPVNNSFFANHTYDVMPTSARKEIVMVDDSNCPKWFLDPSVEGVWHEIPAHPIPKLPVLEEMVARVKNHFNATELQSTIIFGVQHILETTASLFKAFIDLGIPAENIWVMGKIYSTSLPVAKTIRALGIHLADDPIPQTPDGYRTAVHVALQQLGAELRNLF